MVCSFCSYSSSSSTTGGGGGGGHLRLRKDRLWPAAAPFSSEYAVPASVTPTTTLCVPGIDEDPDVEDATRPVLLLAPFVVRAKRKNLNEHNSQYLARTAQYLACAFKILCRDNDGRRFGNGANHCISEEPVHRTVWNELLYKPKTC